ncbi:hypothetical protein BKA82DRAFT_4020429 [Pisolithus tinctorius]|nr:hypothetical protein BKA82DRAFT_4020429 [Pisolithus tinctorius]
MKQVNVVILPALGLDTTDHNLSEGTAQQWLRKLGYELKEAKKGIYVDGHEQEDVVAYHKEFLAKFAENKRVLGYDAHTLMTVLSLLSLNWDLVNSFTYWSCMMKVLFMQMNFDASYMCDESQVKENAGLPINHQLKCTDACEIIYPGKNNDRFWTNEKLVKQVKKVIAIFEYMYPNSVTKFVFDQSLAHGAFAKDALNAKEMNVQPGGKQWLMHNTFIPMDNPNPDLHGNTQAMVFPPDLPPHPDFEFHGQAKGMQCILRGCGLISVLQAANGGKVVGECRTCKLSLEAQEQLHWEALATAEGADKPGKSNLVMLQEPLRTGCFSVPLTLVYPQPLFWPVLACVKPNMWPPCSFCTASDSTFLTTKHLVPQILDDCPAKMICASFHKTWHYMDAYRKGLNAHQAEFAVKKYKSHRHCGQTFMMSIGVLLN